MPKPYVMVLLTAITGVGTFQRRPTELGISFVWMGLTKGASK